jgi:hypothetical protein|tara:strand:- start:712 stop:840 length:129 start_codon:yes stop_codon:yes gene_type:complete
MVIIAYKRKWVVIDKNNKIVIITCDKGVARKYARWRLANDRV